MKGKSEFTKKEIEQLRGLIKQRIQVQPSKQKGIRQKMRDIGFYGQDDWGIIDIQLEDLDKLIVERKIKIVD